MNISLPDALKTYVDEQLAGRGFSTSSEYVRELIRRDQDRQQLRTLLLDGAGSAPAAPADGAYFDALRSRVRQSVGCGERGRSFRMALRGAANRINERLARGKPHP